MCRGSFLKPSPVIENPSTLRQARDRRSSGQAAVRQSGSHGPPRRVQVRPCPLPKLPYTCTISSTNKRVKTMRVVTYSEARSSLKSVLDQVHDDADVTIISRRGGADAVLMSLDHYESIMETMHLLSTPANAAHLAKSIDQHKAGKATRRNLVSA